MSAAPARFLKPGADLGACTLVVGELVGIEGGKPVVRFPGSPHGGVEAATIVPRAELEARPATAASGASGAEPGAEAGIPVMIALRSAAPPVIVGVILESLEAEALAPPDETARPEQTVYVDGEKVSIRGKREIVLKCGQSEILLRSDGKVIIKGREIVSRASDKNRIKGASVNIN